MQRTRYKMTHFTHPSFVQTGRRQVAALRNAGILRNGDEILDFGCGWGRICLRIADAMKDAQITAVDMNPDCIAYVDRRANESSLNIEALRRSTPNIPGAIFDVVLAYNVFQHLPARVAVSFLRRMMEQSRRGVFFTYPDRPRTTEPSEWLPASMGERYDVYPTYDQSRSAPEDVVTSWSEGHFVIEPMRDISPCGYVAF